MRLGSLREAGTAGRTTDRPILLIDQRGPAGASGGQRGPAGASGSHATPMVHAYGARVGSSSLRRRNLLVWPRLATAASYLPARRSRWRPVRARPLGWRGALWCDPHQPRSLVLIHLLSFSGLIVVASRPRFFSSRPPLPPARRLTLETRSSPALRLERCPLVRSPPASQPRSYPPTLVCQV